MDFNAIIKYQEEDLKLFKIERDILNSKDRKIALEARDVLKSAEAQLKEMELKSADYKKQFDTLNNQFNNKKQKCDELKAKGEKATNEEEINTSINELSGVSRELQSLSSQLFNLIKQMDELSKNYVDLVKRIKTAREAYDKGRDKLNALKASKEQEKQELTAKLETLQKEVDGKIMEKYLQLRNENIMPVITKLRGDHCPSCGIEISEARLEELKTKGYIECESCRRVITK